MEADTSDIDAKIAALQAERARKLAAAERERRDREKEEAKVLIGSTPTKSKRKAEPKDIVQLPSRPVQPKFVPKVKVNAQQPLPPVPVKPAQSTMSSGMAALIRSTSSDKATKAVIPRSSSFATRPTLKTGPSAGPSRQSKSPELAVDEPDPQRDGDDLTILEDLRPGPQSFGKDPEGEDEWLHLEPNSKIRLLKRVLPHSDLQDHLSGRYILPPSLLYSVIRLSRDGATYDIPVDGDFVTIAVVAERGDIKVGGSKEAVSEDEDEDAPKQGDKPKNPEDKAKEDWKKKRGPRKYLNLKLCSLPPRNEALGGKGSSGDALLQLLLFQSDSVVHHGKGKGDEAAKPVYKGGSGGAYEKWCNLTVGSVIAILNPRVLRPLRSGPQAPHPLTLPLALNPTSADAITLIGQARDLGCCSATQKDGNRCRTWVDLRQSQVCEYHVHAAVQRQRAGRAEFTASTSSFSLSTRGGASGSGGARGGKYDPQRKTGLLPRGGGQSAPRQQDNGGGGITYVVGGKSVNTRSDGGLKGFGDEHVAEKLGRNRAGKRKRRIEEAEAEKALSKLLDNDGNSGSTGAKYLSALGLNNVKKKQKEGEGGEMEDDDERKRPFSAGAIKKIGFDPTAKKGDRNDEDTAKRLQSIASLKANTDRPLNLSRPVGLSRSNVRAPPERVQIPKKAMVDVEAEDDMIDLD